MKKILNFTFVFVLIILSVFFSACANHTQLVTVTDKKKMEEKVEKESPEDSEEPENPEDPEDPEEEGEGEEDDSEEEIEGESGEGGEGTEDTQTTQDESPEENPEESPVETPEEDPKKQLTLMVYMAADNDLESYALQNLKMLEQGKSGAANVIVLLDRAEGYDETNGNWTDTRLFEVCRDAGNGSLILSRRLSSPELGISYDNNTELDMANPYVLKKFIEFCKTNYEAEKYALVIWGHGTGWRYSAEKAFESFQEGRAVAIDDKTGSYMTVAELGKAVRNQGLSVIGFDTCFAGVFENIYELKDCAEYTVACPGVIPSDGWNYKMLLERIQEAVAPTASAETPSVSGSQNIAEAMAESSSVQVTIFINKQIKALMRSFEAFSKALADSIQNQNDRKTVLETLLASRSYRYFQYPCDLYLDFISMSDLYKDFSDPTLQTAAVNLRLQSEKAAYSLEQLQPGIGIHFIPLISAHTTATTHSSEYIKNQNITGQGKFIQDSLWWVPTLQGNSGSLLDKLFYTSY